jgi:hypothetical protein
MLARLRSGWSVSAEILKDRTLRPLIAMALVRKMPQGIAKLCKPRDLGIEFRDMSKGNILDLMASARLIRPQPQQLADALDRKS